MNVNASRTVGYACFVLLGNAMTITRVRLIEEVDMRRAALLVSAVLAVTLSGCGTATTAEDESGPPAALNEAPFQAAGDEVKVSCGGTDEGWAPSVMARGVPGVLTEDQARHIFDDLLSDPRTGEEAALSLLLDGVDAEWRVLHDGGNALTIGLGRWTEHGPTGNGTHSLRLERDGHRWQAAGWGDCQLSPVLKDGHSWAEVTAYKEHPESTRVTAQVSERECVSGRDPEPFLQEPFVVETDASVTVYWTSEPSSGSQTCQGNPSVDRVVELDQPLGTRLVLDGSSFPPREVPTRQ